MWGGAGVQNLSGIKRYCVLASSEDADAVRRLKCKWIERNVFDAKQMGLVRVSSLTLDFQDVAWHQGQNGSERKFTQDDE